MKLHPFHRKILVADRHNDVIAGAGTDDQIRRQALRLNHQGMIAHGAEGIFYAAKNRQRIMSDIGQLAMHDHRRAHNPGAKSRADRLMPEANAQDRDARTEVLDCRARDAGLLGRARAG